MPELVFDREMKYAESRHVCLRNQTRGPLTMRTRRNPQNHLILSSPLRIKKGLGNQSKSLNFFTSAVKVT